MLSKIYQKVFVFSAIVICCEVNAMIDTITTRPLGMVVYLEIYGHNYYGFKNANATGRWSFNFGVRKHLINTLLNFQLTVGWGFFKEVHYVIVPNQPTISSDDFVNFFPIEIDVHYGRKHNFLELGYSHTFAIGTHEREYRGSNGAATYLFVNNGMQFIPRIGYLYLHDSGFWFRASFAPHFYPSSYDDLGLGSYKIFIDTPWLPVGLSCGFII